MSRYDCVSRKRMEINIPKWRPRVCLTYAKKGEKGGTAHGPFPLGRPHLNVEKYLTEHKYAFAKRIEEFQEHSKSSRVQGKLLGSQNVPDVGAIRGFVRSPKICGGLDNIKHLTCLTGKLLHLIYAAHLHFLAWRQTIVLRKA